MLDLLILGGAYLYTKYNEKVGGMSSRDWTPDVAREKVIELAKICAEESSKKEKIIESLATTIRNQDGDIKAIQRVLDGLSPINVNSQLDEIYNWMHAHVESEQKELRKMARNQLYWNVILATGAGIAVLFSILRAVRP